MKRMLGAAALFVLAASTAGCGFKIFETSAAIRTRQP
jgi:hypothetical protein